MEEIRLQPNKTFAEAWYWVERMIRGYEESFKFDENNLHSLKHDPIIWANKDQGAGVIRFGSKRRTYRIEVPTPK